MRIVNPIGKKGEDIAVEYLQKRGYKILERNYRKHYGEIDIISLDQKDQTVVFVEVKTRTSTQFGTPLEAITSWKLKPLLKTAQLYIMEHPNHPPSLRMDAIAVVLDENLEIENVEHIKNISRF